MILAHSVVGDQSAPHLAFLLHGVLGAGHNLRSLAKRLTERRADWRIVLVDIRLHGKSIGFQGPHTLEACTEDLVRLAEHLGQAPRAVLGHSLGGKIALRYGLRHEAGGQRDSTFPPRVPGTLAQIWTLDSDPGAQAPGGSHQVHQVLSTLLQTRGPFQSRQQALSELGAHGLSTGLCNWLATSLEKDGDQLRWRFELDAIHELLSDYFAVDYWDDLVRVAGDTVPHSPHYDLLVAANSDRWSGSMRERARTLERSPRMEVHWLENAGHWVHVDNPDGLLEILATHLV